jgi:hypothetical protein
MDLPEAIDSHANEEDDHFAVDLRRHPLRDDVCHGAGSAASLE